jgi:hypothetical protein
MCRTATDNVYETIPDPAANADVVHRGFYTQQASETRIVGPAQLDRFDALGVYCACLDMII